MLSLLVNSMSKKHFKESSILLKKQIETQLKHYEALSDMKREFHSFKHDYINHMHCISSLISANKNEEALNYINKLSNTQIILKQPYESGNSILDSIITEKVEIAEKNNTEIRLEGLFTDKFDPVDLCIIFSNALDNAIEACSKIDGNKTIDISLNIQQGYQFISICNPALNDCNENFSTTKDDKIHHGFGIMNIRNVVEKYHGTCNINNSNNFFTLNLI